MVWACTVSLAATPAPFYFLRVREMFQFPGLPPHRLCVQRSVCRLITARGFPIRRSSALSPRAAPRGISLLRHVLHRHERPRHPPNARGHGLSISAGSPPVATTPCPTTACLSSHAHACASACHCCFLQPPHLVRCHAAVPDCCLAYARQQAITTPKESGGDEETRTPDPLRAKEVLSQLSYIPNEDWWAFLDSNQRPHPYQGCALTN